MITIENEYISADFAAKGAELQSLKSKKHNLEYMWSGNPDFWGKYSPVLFPVVGALKNGSYSFEGSEYKLPRHGFARDREFDVEQLNPTEVVFILKHDSDTLKIYPFEFELRLQYKISGAELTCTYVVLNPADKNLLFSIGSHPAFATPVKEGLKYEDYFLQFNKDSNLSYHKIDKDLIDNDTVTIPLKNKILPLRHELFYDDAFVFKTLKSDYISLRNTGNEHGIDFRFEGFPYFGIWAAKDADFVCLEAWCGVADGTDHNQELSDKEGVVTLAPNSRWERSWSVTCF